MLYDQLHHKRYNEFIFQRYLIFLFKDGRTFSLNVYIFVLAVKPKMVLNNINQNI